jgi:hypothetical protein
VENSTVVQCSKCRRHVTGDIYFVDGAIVCDECIEPKGYIVED